LQKLTIDQAVAEFRALAQAELTPGTAARSCADAAGAPEETEARYFRWAEALLRLSCHDATRCTDHRCRRSGRCRHLAELAAQRQGSRRRRADRRTPGATALRHAIWVHMNAREPASNSPEETDAHAHCRSRPA
jgi:hypothetical protein